MALATVARVKALGEAPARAAVRDFAAPDIARNRPLSDENWIAKYAPRG